MDTICTRCGEPWDIDEVLHGQIDEFDRDDCLIRRCPCCRTKATVQLSVAQRERLEEIAEVAKLFGDDVDGFVAFLEDLQLV